MPVLYVKAVSVEAEWEPTSIGYRPNVQLPMLLLPWSKYALPFGHRRTRPHDQCRCSVVELRRSPLEFLVTIVPIFLGSKPHYYSLILSGGLAAWDEDRAARCAGP